jgi:cytochrome c-type biogenesis protein CcmH
MAQRNIRRGLSVTNPCLTLLAIFLLLFFAFPARAQEAQPATTPEANSSVTADDVNAIAHKMYCPVCENIPLDVCPTDACAQWRAEIKSELEAGQSETQIIDTFVARYGDRVVGTPQDPTLRALSLVTPWLIGIIVVAVAGVLLVRWWRRRATVVQIAPSLNGTASTTDEEYRARLERDLQQRR